MTPNKTISLGTLTRTIPFTAENQRNAEDGSPVIGIAISSEYPVMRDFGNEVLQHSPDAVDLSRMVDGAPFCVDHNLRDQVGVLENVRLGADKVLRADVRFSRSQRGQDILHDMLDGIRKHISVGYQVRKMKLVRKNGEPDMYEVVDWLPFEASTVAVPADPTVGVGRALDPDNANAVEIVCDSVEERGLEVTTEASTVTTSTETLTLNDAGQLVKDEYTSTTTYTVSTEYEQTPPDDSGEEESAGEELAETPAEEAAEEADEARHAPTVTVAERTPYISVESNRMEHINVADPIVLSDKEKREYNIANAIEGVLSGNRSGLEFEVSDTLAKQLGREAASGFFIPTNYRTMTSNTSTAGAELVFTQQGEFVDALRAQAVVMSLGARVVPANQKVSYPRATGTTSAQWIDENGTGATAQDLTFDNVTLDPKNLIAQAGFSRKLLQISPLAVDQLVRDAFVKDFAIALDKAALQGSGSGQPTGVLYASGVNSVSGTSGSLATFAMFVDAETQVLQSNAMTSNAAYVVTPGLAGKLKQTLKNASGTDASFILAGGEINGYKAVVSNNLPWTTTVSHAAVFGDFSNVILADGGAIEVLVDKLKYANAGNIVVTGQWLADVVILQPKAFAKLTNLKTA